MEKISHFINGKKFSVKDSRKAAIFNPALGEQIAEVELASRETVNLATESAAKAFMMSDNPVLLTTADHPLLNVRIIENFVQASVENRADFIVGLVPYEVIKNSFPESRRTKLQFSDQTLCGSNLFFLKSEKCSNILNLWTKLEALRKSPWKLASQFGLLYLIRYKLGMLTTQDAFNVLSRQTDCKASYVIIDQPRAAIDVDSWEDLSLAERIIGADSESND